MKKIGLLFVILIYIFTSVQAQKDSKSKIKEFVDTEIHIIDNFAGQSITLIKEKKEYFIIRKFFGSGVPVVGTAKYKVEFNSDYQISFSEIVEKPINEKSEMLKEEFILSMGENGLNLYLNRLKIMIK